MRCKTRLVCEVSIHAPREGCDQTTLAPISITATRFQFTHPGRGATQISDSKHFIFRVSIHAPREGCDAKIQGEQLRPEVSIHAPREGCDAPWIRQCEGCVSFNSRTPGGVRLESLLRACVSSSFNSRTPGGVRRSAGRPPSTGGRGFNSRTPGGVRLLGSTQYDLLQEFQFTHPGRGATSRGKTGRQA